jgi:hypothetical protein
MQPSHPVKGICKRQRRCLVWTSAVLPLFSGSMGATVVAWVEAGRRRGTSDQESAQPFPCDRHLRDADDEYYRAVDVDAPAPVLFRWLYQLKIAPYSYDWIDLSLLVEHPPPV